MRGGTLVGMLLLTGAAGLVPAGQLTAETITATQVDAKTIRVVVPGTFETDFTLRKGFGHTWFDLKHDPQKKHDLAPVANENGFFWVKAAAEGQRGASWYANPSKEMELLEAGPVRVRVRLKGTHMRYGKSNAKASWNDLGFELTWTVYPTGHIYGDYALIAGKPVKVHHFLAIIKSTGHWGPYGKGAGAKEAHCVSDAGPDKPSRWKNKGAKASLALQWSDGPTHFTDILMTFYKGKYYGSYWNAGFRDKDYRAGLDIMSMFADKTIPAGGMHVPVMFRIADDMNDPKTASLYANAYRTPGKLTVTKGTVVTDDPGDFDADGYNESEGCYVLRGTGAGVVFTLPDAKTPRMAPAFKVLDWKSAVPKVITLGNRTLQAGNDFNAAVTDGALVLQVLSDVREVAEVTIR